MQLVTVAKQSDFHRHFTVFEEAVKENSWRRIANEVARDIKGTPFLDGYLREKFRIAFALKEISEFKVRHGHLAFPIDKSTGIYEAFVLIVLYGQIAESVGRKQGDALARRIVGALKNPADMGGLIFELQVLTHFAYQGFELSIPESKGSAIFDALITRNEISFEIECKMVSGDKGRQIHRRTALEIHHQLERELRQLIASFRGGLLVRVIFVSRPSKKFNDRVELAKRIRASIFSAQGGTFNDYRIDLAPFDVHHSPFFAEVSPTEDQLREFLKKFGIVNREVMSISRGSVGAIVFSLESEMPDRLLEETFETVKDAARRQLSGSRPGLVCVKFEGLSSEQMMEVGAERGEASALRILATEFLNSNAGAQISVLAYFADGGVKTSRDGAVTRTGVTYYFINDENQFASIVEREKLFGDSGK